MRQRYKPVDWEMDAVARTRYRRPPIRGSVSFSCTNAIASNAKHAWYISCFVAGIHRAIFSIIIHSLFQSTIYIHHHRAGLVSIQSVLFDFLYEINHSTNFYLLSKQTINQNAFHVHRHSLFGFAFCAGAAHSWKESYCAHIC